jgi:hypothetical protein
MDIHEINAVACTMALGIIHRERGPLRIEIGIMQADDGNRAEFAQITLYFRLNLLPHSRHSFASGPNALPHALQ